MRRPHRGKRKRIDVIGWAKVLTESEQCQLMDYLKKTALTGYLRSEAKFPQLKATLLIYDLMLRTGIRANELCKLRVQDTPQVLGLNAIEVYRGKGDKDRTIPVSKRMVKELAAYIKNIRGKTMPRHIRRGDITRPVFYSQRGRPFTPNGLYRKFRLAGQRAGIRKRLHPHMFRHTFAVNTIGAGVDIHTLQHLMGHSDIRITVKYLHFADAQIRGLGERLDSRLDDGQMKLFRE